MGLGIIRFAVRAVSVALVSLLFCGHSAKAEPSNTFYQKDGWLGAIVTKDRIPTGCAVFTQMTGEMRFAVFHDRSGAWMAIFDRPASASRPAGFRPNMKWEMELLVDGVSVHNGTAVVDGSGIASLLPPLSPIAVQALSRGKLLEVSTVRGKSQYSLAGSANAIEAASKCMAVLNSPQQVPTGVIQPRPQGPSSGTGFFVNGDGDILTNAHVVNGCTSVSGGLPGSSMRTIRVAARDPSNDLALLKSDLRPTAVPAMRIGVRTGEGISIYGYPLAGILPSTGNFTLGNVTATAGLRDDSRMLQISAPVQFGNSGGPLLDQAGNIVGIVVGKLNTFLTAKEVGDIPQNVNFAIKSTIILNFLEANGVRSDTHKSDVPILPADLADRAKAFTAFIVCHR